MNISENITHVQDLVAISPDLWAFEPCIAEKTLLKYERKIGIRLPEEYRAFLLHIGNGSKQPYLGLYPIEETLRYVGDKNLHFLAQAFPFQEEYNITNFELYHVPLPLMNFICPAVFEFVILVAG